MKKLLLFFIIADLAFPVELVGAGEFKDLQFRFPRVREAYSEKLDLIKSLFEDKGCEFPPEKIFLRIFKEEDEIELWARSRDVAKFVFIKTYEIVTKSGTLGPKRKQGDSQVPEGFYFIDGFNPQSSFWLSLRINHPNEADRILGEKNNLGGNIFIHGSFVTIGCVPITNNFIKKLYVIAVETKDNGQNNIPVHVFPFIMNDQNMREFSELLEYKEVKDFWENIREGYVYFERYHKLPRISVNKNGKYIFR